MRHAYALAKANGGAPGVDGESFADIESGGLEEWLNGLRKDLHDKDDRRWADAVRYGWLQVPVEERDANGKRRLTGGKGNGCGTPQGGVANLYVNRMLTHLVMQSRGKAQEALEWTRGVLERLGLTLNEEKTSIRDARQERFGSGDHGSRVRESTMKPVGKPDARNRHVRFDERDGKRGGASAVSRVLCKPFLGLALILEMPFSWLPQLDSASFSV